jgi:hypothetical protein
MSAVIGNTDSLLPSKATVWSLYSSMGPHKCTTPMFALEYQTIAPPP